MKKYSSVVSMLKDIGMSKKFIKSVERDMKERSLATTLCVLRCEKGWTTDRMIKKLGWSKKKFDQFEVTGNSDLKLGDLFAYCDALHIGLELMLVERKEKAKK